MSLFNRAAVVHKNFRQRLETANLPRAKSLTSIQQSQLSASEFIDLFESQVMSRHLDLVARQLKNKGECFYTIGSSGHEGNAALGKVFRHTDMAFLHYRSGALFFQRQKHLPDSTPIYDLCLSLTASADDPISGGRHKVFGSDRLFTPPQTSTIASHLPKAVGAAFSIARAYDLQISEKILPQDGVILCNFGDASANHSTAQGAINMASWVAYQGFPLPIVFVCEDNGVGISVPTPKNWIAASFQGRPNLHYLSCDGLNLHDCVAQGKKAAAIARERKQPVFLHMKTVRLLGHAGSDMESTYHSMERIEKTEGDDPLLHSARLILESGWLCQEEILNLYNKVGEQVSQVAESVVSRPKLQSITEVAGSITACADPRPALGQPLESKRLDVFTQKEFKRLQQKQHMAKLINYALTDLLLQYQGAVILGEDVGRKGGVYHVTENLQKRFGKKRVFNSLLDEQSILGVAMGMAHNGFIPIPEIQFLAYVHNAEDQIRGEAATLPFFSEGQFTNPMVIRVAGLAYQKGFGGHYHNDNSFSVFRDVPGLILACPSNGDEAVKMLRTCVRQAYEQGRVSVFLEPIALYMTRDLHQEEDKLWSFSYPDLEEEIPLGEIGVCRDYSSDRSDLTIISYANGYYLSHQVAKKLQDKGHSIKLINLRWLKDYDQQQLKKELQDQKRVLIVDECRHTGGGIHEEILSFIFREVSSQIEMDVETAADCFVPLGVAATAGLPSVDSVLEKAQNLLQRDVL